MAAASAPADASKVGVAAAVNPDAFSSLSGAPTGQLNIGKSIFFNERIKTTDSGLVQVLLVDGSTFTVGPGSDLVIDKFVYNPKKGTGEITTTFSKGVMRYVGGKISKNEDAVKMKTPAGAIAIRGGMYQIQMTAGGKGIISFLYGVGLNFTAKNGEVQNLFQPGYTLDLTGVVAKIRPTTAADTNSIMKAFAKGGSGTGTASTGGNGGTTPPPGNGNTVQASNTISEIINTFTQTQIQTALQDEIDSLNNLSTPGETPGGQDEIDLATPGETPGHEPFVPPTTPPFGPPTTPPSGPPTTPPQAQLTSAFGYTGGAFLQASANESFSPAGTLRSRSWSDFGLLFNSETQAFAGAGMTLYANEGGGAKITFVPLPLGVIGANGPQGLQSSSHGNEENTNGGLLPEDVVALFAGVADTTGIQIYHETNGGPPTPSELTVPATLISGGAALVGVQGATNALCRNCEFLKWGAWAALAEFKNQATNAGTSNVAALGYWTAGDIARGTELPTTGNAFYTG
ncbi:MAG: hypothetical protein ACAH19_14440, partial [Methyloceanibacter sp.]